MSTQSISRPPLPEGYSWVKSNDNCPICLIKMKGCNKILAHEDPPKKTWFPMSWFWKKKENVPQRHLHPHHYNCMKTNANLYKRCSVCRAPIMPFNRVQADQGELVLNRDGGEEIAELAE